MAINDPQSPDDVQQMLGQLPPFAQAELRFLALADAGTRSFRVGLAEDARRAVSDVADRTRASLLNATLVPYAPAAILPPQHWMSVSEAGAATLPVIQEVVTMDDSLPFTATTMQANDIRLLACRFSFRDDARVALYRTTTSTLGFRKAYGLSLLRDGEVYKELAPTDLLQIRSEFDVVVASGFAFFRSKSTFERAFGFYDELKKASLDTFNEVTANLSIAGHDELRAACTSQPQMMAKMASVHRSMTDDPEYAAAMTMDKLVAYIALNASIDIDVVTEGGVDKLEFDPSPRRRFQIPKLLDDDFLRSVLTDRDYDATAKSRANAE